MLLVFTCGLRYPKEVPIIEVRWNGLRASLTDLQHAMLQTLLDTKVRMHPSGHCYPVPRTLHAVQTLYYSTCHTASASMYSRQCRPPNCAGR